MTGSTIALLAPALSINAVLFAGGLGFAIAQSFGLLAPVGVSQLTTGHYAAAMQTTEFTQSLILTLHVAVTSTLLSAVAALVVSLSLHSLTPALPALRTLLQIPIAVPHVAMSIATIHLIAPSGLVARVLHSAGLVNNPSDFPALLQDRWGGAIILVYILKETPFLAIMCLTVLARVDAEQYSVARTLGASTIQRLRYVTLPILGPVLAAGSAVVFAYVFSAFEVPYLMGRPYPTMLGVLAQRKFMGVDLPERPQAIAIALVGAALAVVVIAVYARLERQVHSRSEV